MNKQEKTYNYLYKITNLINRKYYYGIHSTNNLDDGYMGGGTLVMRSVKKYGKDNFTKEIVANYKTRKEASDHEKRTVTLELVGLEECYNLRAGGDNENFMSQKAKDVIREKLTGRVATEESRARMSKSQKGLKTGSDNPNFGKPKSLETKAKMRESNIGQKRSAEARKKMSDLKIGDKHPNYGKSLPECVKIKISSSNPNNKSCIVRGVLYHSVGEASRMLGISRDTVKGRIISKNPIYNEWKYE
jgi:group I intron endonuclease